MTDTGMTLEGFLGHRTREGGEKATYFTAWRKKENQYRNSADKMECSAVVWLHCKQVFRAVWQHSWPRVITDRDTKEPTAVWMKQCKCIEDEAVLRAQYHRNRQTGERTRPPTICPICRLNEHVRQLVKDGKLSWTDVLFKYHAGEDTISLHAGGIYGAYSNPKLSDAQHEELAKAKISQKEAWKENAMASCKYLCFVVDNSNPSEGVQVSLESSSIGDELKRKLAEEIEARGQEGNPLLSPYALKFKYFPNEKDARKRYAVQTWPKAELSEEIRDLIMDSNQIPDISYILSPWNMKALRASMEENCLFELDWDWIFGPVEAECDEKGYYRPSSASSTQTAPEEPEPPKTQQKVSQAPSQAQPAQTQKKALRAPVETKPAPEPAEGSEPCVKCGFMMGPDDLKCGGCGQEYAPVQDGDNSVPF